MDLIFNLHRLKLLDNGDNIILKTDTDDKKELNEKKKENNEIEIQPPINYVRRFIDKNKDKIKEKTICYICLGSYTYFNKSKHCKSKKHLAFVNRQKIKLEKIDI